MAIERSHSDAIRKDLFDEEFLRRVEMLAVMARRIFAGRSRAEQRSRRLGSGLEFADHRDYAPGDDLRYLDWNVYGRSERLLLRQFEEEEDLSVYFLIDCSRSMAIAPVGHRTKLDAALRIAAALAYVALSNLDRVSLVPFSDTLRDTLPALRGKAQFFKILQFLSGVRPSGTTNTREAFRAFAHRMRRRGLVVILSDFYDPAGYQEGLNYLAFQRFEPLAVQLYDEAELSPTVQGELQLIDCETGETREITLRPTMVERYRRAFETFSSELERACRQTGTLHFKTASETPLDELVLRVFRAGRFLA